MAMQQIQQYQTSTIRPVSTAVPPHRREDCAETATKPHSFSPVFVVGCPRSGTTLTQARLSTFERIAIPPEDDFILRFYHLQQGDLSRTLDHARIQYLLDDLYDHDGGTFRHWHVERPAIQSLIDRCDARLNLRHLIELIYLSFLMRFEGKTRWGCKVPYFASHIKTLTKIFPDAQFVHVVRDPRAVFLSMRDRRHKGATHFPRRPEDAAYLWRRLVAAADSAGKDLPGAFLRIPYEALVGELDIVSRLASFLGEPLPDNEANYYENLKAMRLIPSQDMQDYVKPTLDGHSGKRWKHILEPVEVAIIDRIAGEQMRRLGYKAVSEPVPWSAGFALSAKRSLYWLNDNVRPLIRQRV